MCLMESNTNSMVKCCNTTYFIKSKSNAEHTRFALAVDSVSVPANLKIKTVCN